tara:strand:+ start:276 stop:611 length:336 start_codon:yes stop_codon:yes gene_type:complete
MKKFNSLHDLSSLIPKNYKSVPNIETKTVIPTQNLEAHFSVKGRAGNPVIIIKGFSESKKDEIKNIAKTIKNMLGIGGSIKNNEIYFQGNKRDEITSILESLGHNVKRVGG